MPSGLAAGEKARVIAEEAVMARDFALFYQEKKVLTLPIFNYWKITPALHQAICTFIFFIFLFLAIFVLFLIFTSRFIFAFLVGLIEYVDLLVEYGDNKPT